MAILRFPLVARPFSALTLLAAGALLAACGTGAAAAPQRAPATSLARTIAVIDPGAPLDGASIQLPPGALSADTLVSIADARTAALALFPDVTVMRVEPAADLGVAAHIRVPYSEAMVRAWGVADERQLLLYGVDDEGLWAAVPARIIPEDHVAIADVTRLTSWAVMPGGLLTAWQQRALLGSAFAPAARNVLLLPGWNASPWDACMLSLAAALASNYDHVLVYAYPSALDIAGNARWLRDAIARAYPGVVFDAIGFSEGGLVARAAVEPGSWNGGVTIAAQMRALVTIAAPHDGLIADAPQSLLADQASLQMRAGSPFLAALNAQPRQSVRYYAIAGDGAPRHESDSLVPVASALARSVPLAIAGSATLPLIHAPSRDGSVAGMPCDARVYAQLRAFLAD